MLYDVVGDALLTAKVTETDFAVSRRLHFPDWQHGGTRRLGHNVRHRGGAYADTELSELVHQHVNAGRDSYPVQIHKNRLQRHGDLGRRFQSHLHGPNWRHRFRYGELAELKGN